MCRPPSRSFCPSWGALPEGSRTFPAGYERPLCAQGSWSSPRSSCSSPASRSWGPSCLSSQSENLWWCCSVADAGGGGGGVSEIGCFIWGGIVGGSCYKYNFCHDKTRLLLHQKYSCRDKSFVTKKCRDKTLLQQHYVCHDKSFVVRNICHNKSFVRTKDVFCCEKYLSQQKFCHDKHNFVTTNIILS